MVKSVLESEAPVREDILAQRIARAHGWLRTGNKIRERIDQHLRTADRTEESSGVFLWKSGTIQECLPYRWPHNEGDRRGIPEISLAELTGVIVDHMDVLNEPDPALQMARILGVERLTASSRARLVEAIERARLMPKATSAV